MRNARGAQLILGRRGQLIVNDHLVLGSSANLMQPAPESHDRRQLIDGAWCSPAATSSEAQRRFRLAPLSSRRRAPATRQPAH